MSEQKRPDHEVTLHHVGDERVDRLTIVTDRAFDYTIFSADGFGFSCGINFQHGPVCEVGAEGVTNESLLAIVAHRLQGFQEGPMACRENEMAMLHVRSAIEWLQSRTRRRLAAGVEGRGKP